MNVEGDEIVRTIPAYLSQAFAQLAQQLYIFHYPTRPFTKDSISHDIVRSAIKLQLQEVELEESVDTSTLYYDKSQAETLAFNADGNSSSKVPKIFPRNVMDRITLKSSKVMVDPSTYAVGFFKDREAHLSPLQGVVSLRPSFSYIDKSDKRESDEIAGDEPEEEVKQVQVKFARQENEQTKRLREQSYDYHSKMIAGEPWFHTKYYKSEVERAELAHNKLLCANRSAHANKLLADVIQRRDMWGKAKNKQLCEALKQNSQTPPTSPVKPRATARSTRRRRDSSVSS